MDTDYYSANGSYTLNDVKGGTILRFDDTKTVTDYSITASGGKIALVLVSNDAGSGANPAIQATFSREAQHFGTPSH